MLKKDRVRFRRLYWQVILPRWEVKFSVIVDQPGKEDKFVIISDGWMKERWIDRIETYQFTYTGAVGFMHLPFISK